MWLKFFGKKKLMLAFEYGLILSETAKNSNVILTPEIVKRAEEMLVNEFSNNNLQTLAVDMQPNILSIFETDTDKTVM